MKDKRAIQKEIYKLYDKLDKMNASNSSRKEEMDIRNKIEELEEEKKKVDHTCDADPKISRCWEIGNGNCPYIKGWKCP